ncbi:MAG: hypothetical protein R3E73_06985 [Porticoccaceae bacterium]
MIDPVNPLVAGDGLIEEPVAICRLKRVAADFKEDVAGRMPLPPAVSKWQDSCSRWRWSCLSLTVAQICPRWGMNYIFTMNSIGGGFHAQPDTVFPSA